MDPAAELSGARGGVVGVDNGNGSNSVEEWRKKRELKRRERRRRGEGEDDDDDGTRAFLAEAMGGGKYGDDDDGGGGGDVMMTTAKRRKMEQEAVLEQTMMMSTTKKKMTTREGGGAKNGEEDEDHAAVVEEGAEGRRQRRMLMAQRRKQAYEALVGGGARADLAGRVEGDADDDDDRNQRDRGGDVNGGDKGGGGGDDNDENDDGGNVSSLLDQAAELQKTLSASERAEIQRKEEEARILREASKVQTNALQAAKEVAEGVVYKDPMPSSWTVPRHILEQGEDVWNAVRKEWHMEVQGQDIPPPMKRFVDMKFPRYIVNILNDKKKIKRPTPIQMQGLPVALAGRDMIGIAFTGSGKTLTFTLPLIMSAMEEELRMPLIPGEGPVGIIMAPSRELAKQTYELVQEFCNRNREDEPELPEIRSQLLIGGESVRDQIEVIKQHGVHCVVATPGRLRDVLKRRAMNLFICRYICLDEADRMLDMGFDVEVGEIMNYFPYQRQTLLFSATFPKKFQDFAKQTLVKPVVVNVGRAGAANLDVIQEVEYVKQEAKIVYLLHCLQKTAPPVIIFCERKSDVDDIHEYLLLKGVDAVSIHGDKDQYERNESIQQFKNGERDVLIATDIAAKGLDFDNIQHVINFDMPKEIENYVHRIGRTGRCGKTGVATTFINKSCEEMTLLDLKGLLREARQRIPPVLMMLDDPRDQLRGAAGGGDDGAAGGCSFCGGLGHTIVDCPKIDTAARREKSNKRDVLAGGGEW